MTEEKVTYSKLINADGQPHFGRFQQPVTRINHQDFRYTNPMDRAANRLAKHFHFKQFQFVGLVSDDYMLGCAIVSLKYVSNAFVYLFDRRQGTVRQKSFMQPLSWNCSMVNTPDSGTHRFSKGSSRFQFDANENPRSRNVQITSGSDINIALTLHEPAGFEPIAVCTRTGFNGWTYTQKASALPVSGNIIWDELTLPLDTRFTASYDWSCGYMRRETAWNWASISGHLSDGRSFGANLASGVNETGFNENAVWLDGKLHAIGPVSFSFDKHNRRSPWTITSSDRKLELVFTPAGERTERLNYILLASNFTQLAGTFSGQFVTKEGEQIQLETTGGFCEDHYAKW